MVETVRIIVAFAHGNAPNTNFIENIDVGNGITALVRKIAQFEDSCYIVTSAGKVKIKYTYLGGTKFSRVYIGLVDRKILDIVTIDGTASYGNHIVIPEALLAEDMAIVFKELYALRDIVSPA